MLCVAAPCTANATDCSLSLRHCLPLPLQRQTASAFAALLYFVAPLDFIPDFLVIGLVDDVALILWLVKNYKKELEDFQSWEDAQKIQIEIEPTPIEEEKDQSQEP